MRESHREAGSPVIGRIVLASVVAISLIAAALIVTVWSYRSALAAHEVARGAVNERSASHAAETHLSREREAMNEYLLNPRDEVSGEIKTNHAGFVRNLSRVGVGEPAESVLVQLAIAANERFLATFATNAPTSVGDIQASRRLEVELDIRQRAVLAPLRCGRSMECTNDELWRAQTRRVAAPCCSRSSQARLPWPAGSASRCTPCGW